MAYDAGMMYAVLEEIRRTCGGAKVEKVLQPSRDTVDLVLRGKRLTINAGSAIPHLALTEQVKDNPPTPPMFCMLLRKHLVGALLTDLSQAGFDRVCRLTFAGHDDMGFPTTRTLVVELMGKYNNLILLGDKDEIISALKYVDFSDSEVRQILPGIPYTLPPAQAKQNPLLCTREAFFAALSVYPGGRTCARFIADSFSGVAIGIAREIAFRACGETDTPLETADSAALYITFSDWFGRVKAGEFHPAMMQDETGAPIDYAYEPLSYYGTAATAVSFPTFAALFDCYFGEKERTERMRQRAADILRIVTRTQNRLQKKLELQQEELLQSAQGEEYRRTGDLITANLYRLKRGMTSFTATDYEADPPKEVEVPLDGRLYPTQNAQKMYKLYNKAKTARVILAEQIDLCQKELAYMETVHAFLDKAQSEADLNEIREELYRAGYASKMKGYRPQKQVKLRPMTYVTSGGYRVLCGRNNMQNDLLTFHTADKGDLWFHVKGVPGSHVILVCGGEEPPEADYTEAAQIAAFHSKATGELVAVDYTRVKNVKKPPSSKPGYVTYKTNYTAYVHPKEGKEV